VLRVHGPLEKRRGLFFNFREPSSRRDRLLSFFACQKAFWLTKFCFAAFLSGWISRTQFSRRPGKASPLLWPTLRGPTSTIWTSCGGPFTPTTRTSTCRSCFFSATVDCEARGPAVFSFLFFCIFTSLIIAISDQVRCNVGHTQHLGKITAYTRVCNRLTWLLLSEH
jgi:hypothetical protein